jgi:hypothetical protein
MDDLHYFRPEWICRTHECLIVDICIYGATSAGVIAAIEASRHGRTVALLQPGKGAIHEGKNYLINGMTENFHTYGATITSEHIIFYFDGRELRREKTRSCGHDPLYVMVNLTLGLSCPLNKISNPSYLYADYVRVYAKQ